MEVEYDIAFDATIDADSKVITIDLVSDLSSNQDCLRCYRGEL